MGFEFHIFAKFSFM